MMGTSSGSGNFAGFGARRFQENMETQRVERERAQWEQHQYEQHQYQLQEYEAQRLYDEQEYQRAVNEQLEYERAQHDHQDQLWSSQDGQTESYSADDNRGYADDTHTYADQAYAQEHLSSFADSSYTHPNTMRSNTLASFRTDSTAGLAYEENAVVIPRSTSHSSAYDGCYDECLSSEPSSTDAPNFRRPERETFYDDDFEELTHTDIIGKTHLSLNQPYGVDRRARDSSFHIARATVIQPDLPKAKCADCGEKLEFEDLADHVCLARGTTAASPLTIQLTPIPHDNGLSFGGLLSPTSLRTPATPRSPFFDKYQDLLGDTGPLSPAFSLPSTPADTYDDERPWISKSPHQQETPKALTSRIIDPAAAPIASSTYGSLSVSQYDRPLIQRSTSDNTGNADARRKMIEEQRALKKKVLLAAPAPAAVAKQILVVTKPSIKLFTDGHHKTESCSSVSTATSSLLENPMSHQQTTALSDVSNITPSSSYDQFDDSSSSPIVVNEKVSHKARSQSRGRSEIDLSSIEEMMKGIVTSPKQMPKLVRGKSEPSSPRQCAARDSKRTDRERILEKELERLREKERLRQLQMLRLKEKKRKEREAKRCCVCDCSLSSSRTPFVERDGKLLCARDWKELYLPKCRKCNLAVEKRAVKSSDGALRGVFHRACFACAACDAPFNDESFYVYNKQPYCSRHYHRLNGSLCRECETGIEGDCRQTDTGEKFHPECFRCQWTSKNGPCSEELSTYHSVGGQRLCQRHASKVSLKLARQVGSAFDLSAGRRDTMLHHIS